MLSQLCMENVSFLQILNFIGVKTEALEYKLYVQSHQDKWLQIQPGAMCSVSLCFIL